MCCHRGSGTIGFDHAVIDSRNGHFRLHDVKSGALVRRFFPKEPNPTLIRQAAFGEGGSIVVTGGCRGVVHLFDTETGRRLYGLRHADNDHGVRTIIVSSIDHLRPRSWLMSPERHTGMTTAVSL